MMATNQINLGAPILDSQVASNSVVANGVVNAAGYEPIVITSTATNNNNNQGSTSTTSSTSTSTASNAAPTNSVLTNT